MSNLPTSIHISEEGPREGFQSERRPIPTARKVELIEALAETGVPEINCASFVSRRLVPQMSDAEQVAALIRRREGVRYTGLWLSVNGFDRAMATALDLKGLLFLSASDQFGLRNNQQSRDAMRQAQRDLLDAYDRAGVPVSTAYVFTAFGCNYEGDMSIGTVVSTVGELVALLEHGAQCRNQPPVVVLADTVGWADPVAVERVVGALRDRWPDLRLGLHLHDTRGLGIANAMAGLRLGVSHFESSCGGLGGCPFAGHSGAAGNIATDELVQLCDEMGIETGIDLDRLVDCTHLAEEIVGHPLPSKLTRSGSIASRRRSVARILGHGETRTEAP